MKWTKISKDGLPKEDGTYLIYAPSCAKIVPLMVTAWYNTISEWDSLPPVWAKAITHWMKLEVPDYQNTN